jgi:hypothetical protein
MNAKTVLLWPLWSPKRLGLTAVGVVAVLGILGGLAGAGHSGKPSRAATATAGAAATLAAGQPSPSPTPAPGRVDLAAAVFVSTWASHTAPTIWHAAAAPLATPKLGALLAATDPARVPATKVLPTAPAVTGNSALVPTDAGLVLVVLQAQPDGRQLADDVQMYAG